MPSRRFLWTWALALLGILAGVAALNLLVDPYLMFGMPRIAGFNARKPAPNNHTELAKAYQVARVAPSTVLLGTSRVGLGLDPNLAAWPAHPVYNYGIPETQPYGLLRYLQHTHALSHLKAAVIGLEFEGFINPRAKKSVAPAEWERRLKVSSAGDSNPDRPMQQLVDVMLSVVTLGATVDSVDTLLAQRRLDTPDVDDLGETSEAPYRALVRSDGHYDLFTQKDLDHMQRYVRAARLLAGTAKDSFPDMVRLRAILEFCGQHGIEVTLFIHPYHADLLEIIDRAGLWDRFEAWKRALVVVVEEYRGRPGGPRIALWDFSDYDAYATEVVPEKGDRKTQMQWFWEAGHYKKALGDLVVARLLGADEPRFGAPLTSASIEARLAATRTARGAYRAERPHEIGRVASYWRVNGMAE